VFVLLFFVLPCYLFFFFFHDTATTEIYTLSLHDALPISRAAVQRRDRMPAVPVRDGRRKTLGASLRGASSSAPSRCRRRSHRARSEEHTSELQSRSDLVCRLLLEKKKNKKKKNNVNIR